MHPKKLTSSKFCGPALLSVKWFAPAYLPGDVDGRTHKADIRQIVCPEKNGPLRSRHVSKMTVSNSFVRNSCLKNGSPRKCSGGAGDGAQKSGPSPLLRYTQYPEKRYIGIMVYINYPRVCCGATQNADP